MNNNSNLITATFGAGRAVHLVKAEHGMYALCGQGTRSNVRTKGTPVAAEATCKTCLAKAGLGTVAAPQARTAAPAAKPVATIAKLAKGDRVAKGDQAGTVVKVTTATLVVVLWDEKPAFTPQRATVSVQSLQLV